MNSRSVVGLLHASSLLLAACVVRNMPESEPMAPMSAVDTPVKAHLVDGTVVVFADGTRYAADSLYGAAVHYGLAHEALGTRFTVPLGADEGLPEGPLPATAWHDHGGSLDEEALILESPHTASHGGPGPRLAMVHAWLWPENPDGPLARNNWALSWVRLGLPVPGHPEPRVARALSLAGDGAAYYRTLLRRTAELTRAETTDPSVVAIDRAVARAADRANAVLDGRDTAPLSPNERAALLTAWEGLWEDLLREVDPAVGHRLEPAYREWGAHAGS